MTTFALRAGMAARRSAALCCDVRGSGTPLLLIHGLAASGAMFTPLLPALADRFQVIVPDLRGHGRSYSLGSPSSVAQLAADVGNLLDLLGIARCDLLGYAHGGAVALQFVHQQPERVGRLVLAGTPLAPARRVAERIAALLLPHALRLLGPGTLAPLVDAGGTGSGTAGMRQLLAQGDRRRVADAARTLLGFDCRPWLHTIACPTLVLAAERDNIVPAHHTAALARRLPNATLRTIPGAGHWMCATHPEQFLAALLPWLG
jgi:3-oxoadipate enol-lactonase